jgi:hypothetical protein
MTIAAVLGATAIADLSDGATAVGGVVDVASPAVGISVELSLAPESGLLSSIPDFDPAFPVSRSWETYHPAITATPTKAMPSPIQIRFRFGFPSAWSVISVGTW